MSDPLFNIPDAPRIEWDAHGRLILVKPGKRYAFRCTPGQEAQLVAELRAAVADEQSGINWFDAAVLCHELGRRMRVRLAHHQPSSQSA